MNKLVWILMFLPFLAVGQNSTNVDQRLFEFGIKANYNIYPGVRVFPEVGPDIMRSNVFWGFTAGISTQIHLKKISSSIELDLALGKEPNLYTLETDYDKVASMIPIDNTLSKSWHDDTYRREIIYMFSLSYKYYLSNKENRPYLLIGTQLISPTVVYDSYGSSWDYSDEDKGNLVYVVLNKQKHNTEFRRYYPSFTWGIGYRKNKKNIGVDYKIKVCHFKPYYYGEYETPDYVPFYSKGSYIQKNFYIETGITIYIKPLKKNKK